MSKKKSDWLDSLPPKVANSLRALKGKLVKRYSAMKALRSAKLLQSVKPLQPLKPIQPIKPLKPLRETPSSLGGMQESLPGQTSTSEPMTGDSNEDSQDQETSDDQ